MHFFLISGGQKKGKKFTQRAKIQHPCESIIHILINLIPCVCIHNFLKNGHISFKNEIFQISGGQKKGKKLPRELKLYIHMVLPSKTL